MLGGGESDEWMLHQMKLNASTGECIILPTSRCIQTFIHRLEILMLHLLIELERNPPRNFWTIHDSDFSFLEWWVLRTREWVEVDIFSRLSRKSCFAQNEPDCLISAAAAAVQSEKRQGFAVSCEQWAFLFQPIYPVLI